MSKRNYSIFRWVYVLGFVLIISLFAFISTRGNKGGMYLSMPTNPDSIRIHHNQLFLYYGEHSPYIIHSKKIIQWP